MADLRPDDFEKIRAKMATNGGRSVSAMRSTGCRIVFNYASKSGLIDRPMVYGEGFRRPSKKVLRKHRQAQGPKMFEADEIRRMLADAKQPLKSMILLGINCGYGNSDVGTLPLSALDIDGGWLTYGRPKTGIARRCHIWPETVASLREWMAKASRAGRRRRRRFSLPHCPRRQLGKGNCGQPGYQGNPEASRPSWH